MLWNLLLMARPATGMNCKNESAGELQIASAVLEAKMAEEGQFQTEARIIS